MNAPATTVGRARRLGRLLRLAWGGVCCVVAALVLGVLSILSGTCSK